MQTRALPGFRDFYPDDFALRAHIFRTWRSIAGRYGFEEYDGPPLEPLELYTAKSGEEIVGQLYNFTDKGDRAVALRPEMTPTLARMVAARANGLKKPIRWFSIPQLFRYERQQRGRLREHFQLNCDLIGETSPLADAEIIALSIDVMRAFGFGPDDFKVRLFDRRTLVALLERMNLTEAQLPLLFKVYDKWDRVPADASIQQLREAGIERQLPQVQELAELWKEPDPRKALSAVSTGGDELAPVFQALHDMGLGDYVVLDARVVRGLAYYTGTVFELFDTKGELRAICGGGRYDNLAGALGGVDLPAVGFGFGDVVLGELLKDRGLVPAPEPSCDVFVVAVTGEDMPDVLHLAHGLRNEGFRVEYALSGQKLRKQLDLADARGARVALIVGPEERSSGRVVVKDQSLSTQIKASVPLT
ncbi:MAG: histidine--tRNA ligase, partial [Gemmatimonadales bacterium]